MKAHLVGAGIGSLAAAVFMVRDGGVPGGDITIYDRSKLLVAGIARRRAVRQSRGQLSDNQGEKAAGPQIQSAGFK